MTNYIIGRKIIFFNSIVSQRRNKAGPNTSAPIGAWKCNFPPLQGFMTEQPTDGHEGS